MLSTKVSIALQGTGSSSYQRKIIILEATQSPNKKSRNSDILGHSRRKKSSPAHHPAKKTSILPIVYLFNSHSDMLSPSATPLWSLLFLPRWSQPHLHQNPSNSLFNARSSNFCKKELVIILFLPLVYLLSCVTQSKRKC